MSGRCSKLCRAKDTTTGRSMASSVSELGRAFADFRRLRIYLSQGNLILRRPTNSESGRRVCRSDGHLENNPTDVNLLFPNQVAEVVSEGMGENLRKSPALRFLTKQILRRYFSLLDCAAGTQSRANQFGRLWGVVEATFSHRIASHSPFDPSANRISLPQSRNITQPAVSRFSR